MPKVTHKKDYNGFANKVERLNLGQLVQQVEDTLASFQLTIEERKHANGTRGIRRCIDEGFEGLGGWTKTTVGGIDWTKANEIRAKVGVEVQVSARSDLLAIDLMHLRDSMHQGLLDVGIIIVPDDDLSYFLTDRTPNLRTAIKHIEARARDLPIRVLAFAHDGTGDALKKMRTNLGRTPDDDEQLDS